MDEGCQETCLDLLPGRAPVEKVELRSGECSVSVQVDLMINFGQNVGEFPTQMEFFIHGVDLPGK